MISPVNEGNIYLDLPAEEEGEEADVRRHDCEEWRCEGLGCQRCKRTVETAEVEADLRGQRDAALSALRDARDALLSCRAYVRASEGTSNLYTFTDRAIAHADRLLGESEGEGKG